MSILWKPLFLKKCKYGALLGYKKEIKVTFIYSYKTRLVQGLQKTDTITKNITEKANLAAILSQEYSHGQLNVAYPGTPERGGCKLHFPPPPPLPWSLHVWCIPGEYLEYSLTRTMPRGVVTYIFHPSKTWISGTLQFLSYN